MLYVQNAKHETKTSPHGQNNRALLKNSLKVTWHTPERWPEKAPAEIDKKNESAS